MFQAVNDYVLIKWDDGETVTKSGIILKQSIETVNRGTVISVGRDVLRDGDREPEVQLKEGSRIVFFNKFLLPVNESERIGLVQSKNILGVDPE